MIKLPVIAWNAVQHWVESCNVVSLTSVDAQIDIVVRVGMGDEETIRIMVRDTPELAAFIDFAVTFVLHELATVQDEQSGKYADHLNNLITQTATIRHAVLNGFPDNRNIGPIIVERIRKRL